MAWRRRSPSRRCLFNTERCRNVCSIWPSPSVLRVRRLFLSRAVFPRAGGDTTLARTSWRTVSRGGGRGSSPRARGSRGPSLPPAALLGFIPARAGKPLVGVRTAARHRVHPRSRGGDQATPMLAGSRAVVHPRVCGGHARGRCVWIIAHGSSPRARGSLGRAVLRRRQRGFIPGFIPARAGHPPSGAPLRTPSMVHPRARGAAHPSSSCFGPGMRAVQVHLRACGDSSWFPAFGVSSAVFCARSEHTAAVARLAVLRRVAPPCCSRLWRDT